MVWSVESTRLARCSVPANSGAHLVSSGSTAWLRYRFSASAISVVLNVAVSSEAAARMSGRKPTSSTCRSSSWVSTP